LAVLAGVIVGLIAGELSGSQREYLIQAGDTLLKFSCVDGPDDAIASMGAGYAGGISGSETPAEAPNHLDLGRSTVSGLEQASSATFVERGPEGEVDAAYVVAEHDGRYYVAEVVYCFDRMQQD
jgi:hypothetical protein